MMSVPYVSFMFEAPMEYGDTCCIVIKFQRNCVITGGGDSRTGPSMAGYFGAYKENISKKNVKIFPLTFQGSLYYLFNLFRI